jgi:hypothetical protein
MHISVYLLVPSFELDLDDVDENSKDTAIIKKCEQVFGLRKEDIKLCRISKGGINSSSNNNNTSSGHVREGCIIRNSGLTLEAINTAMQRNQDLYTVLHKTSDSLITLQKQREQDSESFNSAHKRALGELDSINNKNRELSAQVNKFKNLNSDLEKMLENSDRMRREALLSLENLKKEYMIISKGMFSFNNINGFRVPHPLGGYRPPLTVGGALRPVPPLSPKPRTYTAPTPRRRIVHHGNTPHNGSTPRTHRIRTTTTADGEDLTHTNGVEPLGTPLDNQELVVKTIQPKPPPPRQQIM